MSENYEAAADIVEDLTWEDLNIDQQIAVASIHATLALVEIQRAQMGAQERVAELIQANVAMGEQANALQEAANMAAQPTDGSLEVRR